MPISSSWPSVRAQVRRAVHNTFAGPVSYAVGDSVDPTPLTARWGNKVAYGGNGDLGDENAAVIEGIDRLAFDKGQLADGGLSLQQGGRVTLTDGEYAGATFILDVKLPSNGPVTETWLVVHDAGG